MKSFRCSSVLNLFLCLLLIGGELRTYGEDVWISVPLPGRPLSITAVSGSMWVCGTDELIAVSKDAGKTWQIKHLEEGGQNLLTIAFLDEKTGFAAGTDGAVLWTRDGGDSWAPQQVSADPILQASFSDPQHGIVRTLAAVLFTNDGGAHWIELSALKTDAQFEKWLYTFALASLDTSHSLVMLKLWHEPL